MKYFRFTNYESMSFFMEYKLPPTFLTPLEMTMNNVRSSGVENPAQRCNVRKSTLPKRTFNYEYIISIPQNVMRYSCILFFSLHTILLSGFSNNFQSEAEEYQLKAAFIYNFTKFIEWDSSLPTKEFTIGIMGSSPIHGPLAEIARTKTVNGEKIIIRQFNNPKEITFCNILFISRLTSFSLDEILSNTISKGTLVCSEQEEYAKKGTAINFVIINDNLKFEANTKAINSAGLTASSQLLKLAVIVK